MEDVTEEVIRKVVKESVTRLGPKSREEFWVGNAIMSALSDIGYRLFASRQEEILDIARRIVEMAEEDSMKMGSGKER